MKLPMPILFRGDARSLPLLDESVDLVVTSPPYFGLRDYGYDGQIGSEPTPTEFLDALIACTGEVARVLKPSGSIWVNLGDKYATSAPGKLGASGSKTAYTRSGYRDTSRCGAQKSLMLLPERYRIRCVDELGLIARAVIIWAKPNGLPESVTDRVRRSHEDWVHLTKSPRYYSAVDEIRERTQGRADQMTWEQRKTRGDATRQGEQRGTFGGGGMAENPLGKLPGSVWEIATQPLNVPKELGIDHFAAFPFALVRPIIQGWSPLEVCTACGEGRRPVVAKGEKFPTDHVAGERKRRSGVAVGPMDRGAGSQWISGNVGAVSGQEWNAWKAAHPDRISGYACACTPRVGREIREYDYETDSWVTRTVAQEDVAGWTPPPTTPGIVLDPFSGTGTTALVATMLGRTGIGVELSADYIRLAQWRASDPKERARAAGLDPDQVSAIKKQLPGQVDMLDLLAGEAS